MHWIALGVLLLAGFLLLIRWLGSADPGQLARSLKWSFLGLLALGAVAAVVTGRAALVIPVIAAAAMSLLSGRGKVANGNGDEGGSRGRSGARGVMSVDEALDVLGLEPGATHQDVRNAHRNLMQKIHPDRGGSDYLAAKLNEARDVLLGKR